MGGPGRAFSWETGWEAGAGLEPRAKVGQESAKGASSAANFCQLYSPAGRGNERTELRVPRPA